MNTPEYWDAYSIDRLPLGQQVPRGRIIQPGHFHTVVHLCLFNNEGDMLIQRRALDKDTWPGRWDFSLGGSVLAGETSAQGVAREAKEELGITLDATTLRPAFTFNFPVGFDDFYLVDMDVPTDSLAVPNEEVADARWASLDAVLDLWRTGEFISYRESVLRFIFDFRGYPDIFIEEPHWR